MEIIKRLDIQAIFDIKQQLLEKINLLKITDNEIKDLYEKIKGFRHYRLDHFYSISGQIKAVKYIDCVCWNYLVDLFSLEKYMLCTEYQKMRDEITNYKTPEFTIENANNWIAGMKELIMDNVKTLIKTVFENITQKCYYTGSGYSNMKKKKRNNNGIDKHFILTTCDYRFIFGYNSKPTITDDLEKVCYIISGKKLPNTTLKDIMRRDKIIEVENEFFKIKVFKNDNTHYWLNDDIRQKLNYFGANNNMIGEKIRIKEFDNGI